MKKKKEEEHYEIPPSSKNAKEINIQMATINPFFQESSHLPKNLQQHMSMTYVGSIATSDANRMKKKVFYVCYNANYGIYKECVVQFCKKDNPFVCSGSPRVLKKRSWFNLL